MSWTDLAAAFGYGTKLTSQQMQQLRDNIQAAFDGDAGSPNLLTHPIWHGDYATQTATTQTYTDFPLTIFRKKAGMETVRFYARLRRTGGTSCVCRLRIGSLYSSGQQTTADNYTIYNIGTIDISGLSDDTSYEMAVQLKKGDSDTGNALMRGFAVFLE